MGLKLEGREKQLRCKPQQVLFRGVVGQLVQCPACGQRFEGIVYPYGKELLTLPDHLPSVAALEQLMRIRAVQLDRFRKWAKGLALSQDTGIEMI